MSTLKDRLKMLLESRTDERGRFAELESLTKISANSWKSFWHGRQRPTSEMIEAIAVRWPQHAFWLTTGITDAKHGHVDNKGNACYPERPRAKRKSAEGYWEIATAASGWQKHVSENNLELEDQDVLSEHSQKIQLVELEIGRNAEEQALGAVEDSELVAELIKLKSTSFS